MTVQKEQQPQVMTVGMLKKYLDIYHDDLQVTAIMPTGECVGVLDASTHLVSDGNKDGIRVCVFAVTTIKATTGKKVEPVVVGVKV